MAVNQLLRAAMTCAKERPRYAYIAPQYRQAKQVSWDYFRKYAGVIPGTTFNESELRADFANKARIQLLGAENPDALRGLYLDGAVLDEPAQMSPRLWGEVIRPALSDRQGWAMFIGTPMGHNQFFQLHEQAKTAPGWYTGVFRASETGIINAEELASARATMTEEQYAQEFECSWTAAILGAYWGKELERAERDGRILDITIDPQIPVHTAWDLGMSDSTSIWFFQLGPLGEVRVVDYYEASGEGMRHYADVLRAKGYYYGAHLAPHDIAVRELGTGKSRIETARDLGLKFTIVPNLPIMDGINAARMMLPRTWFDGQRCDKGMDAIRQYRARYDERGQVFQTAPLHDWTSHAADAFRYLAVGRDLARSASGVGGMTAEQAAAMYERLAAPRTWGARA